MNFIFHSIDSYSSYEDVSKNQFEEFCKRVNYYSNFNKNFTITFDDGNKSDLLGFEIAKHYGLNTAHFIITSNIGRDGYLSGDDIKCLSSKGVLIGTHTHSHVALIGDLHKLRTNEIDKSCKLLEELLGHQVKSLSVPFGLYNLKVLKKLKSCLDLQVFSSDPHIIGKTRGVIGRFGINSSNINFDLNYLTSSHYSVKRAISFFIKDQLVKTFGRAQYLTFRSMFEKGKNN